MAGWKGLARRVKLELASQVRAVVASAPSTVFRRCQREGFYLAEALPPTGLWSDGQILAGNKDVADMDPPTRWTTLDGPGKLIGLSKAERDKKSLNKC